MPWESIDLVWSPLILLIFSKHYNALIFLILWLLIIRDKRYFLKFYIIGSFLNVASWIFITWSYFYQFSNTIQESWNFVSMSIDQYFNKYGGLSNGEHLEMSLSLPGSHWVLFGHFHFVFGLLYCCCIYICWS